MKSVALILILLLTFSVSGCTEQAGPNEGEDTSKKVTFGYVLWDGEVASTNVMQQVLEMKGYEVDIVAVDLEELYRGLSQGDIDFTTSAWLPVTQEKYWNQYGDQIVYVSHNLEGCRLGLVVPAYVEIDSIEDLNANKEAFDSKIIGIDPDAGIMYNAENAIVVYGLDYTLVPGSTASMTSDLGRSIADKEPIVVTLWSPHGAFSRWDLKYLDDPEKVFGYEDNVDTLTRVGFEEDMPGVYDVLTRFHWSHEDVQFVMLNMENGMSPEEAAAKWIENNPEKVNEWLGE
ncbi:glycine betaine ABC transporter substrate-binding protein [Methanococcoides sp. LMO-2]|uniref:Glycine betaine ABC transporter substrate-binding protein n=1 Tax=Methanococcoides cohabitans TaxID=3136559 RepID=A0ABU9KQD2_9EURY